MRKGLSLVELMIGVAIVGILFAIIGGAVGGSCAPVSGVNSLANRYEVQGVLKAPPGSKQRFGGGEAGETKYSLNLSTDAGPKIVNCTSTQCASLAVGDSVALSCYTEVHISEPNEEECRFDRLLPAPPQ